MATLIYMPTEHLPVLAPELVAVCDPQPGDLVVDCTFGAGGHALAMAARIGPTGRLIAIDRDPAAAERFAELEPELGCEARFIRADFADALADLAADGGRPDVVYLDLGVSSMQLDVAERGF
jgi:16S rRNA (cytosine1402-N4)-methyltransferase